MDHDSSERATNMRAYARQLREQAAAAERAGQGARAFELTMEVCGWEDTAREARGQ
ncbi:MAG TPA: hypothetical protein VFQ42_04150 [Mycobacterium sp.]|nr:hypothetical protein [Mycobacterium sp.]